MTNVRQGSFTDTELGFPLGWDKSAGKGLHRAAAAHADMLRGEMAAWSEVRRQRCAGLQLAYADAITEVAMPVFRHLPPLLGSVLARVAAHYYEGVRPVQIAREAFVSNNSCGAMMSRLRAVGLLRRAAAGRYVLPTLDVLRVFAIRCDGRFSRYLHGVGHQDGPTAVDAFIEAHGGPIPGWAKAPPQ